MTQEPRLDPKNLLTSFQTQSRAELDLSDVRSSLRSAMWRNVGIERQGGKLEDALDMFDFWGRYMLDKIFDDPVGWGTQNLLTVGALMTRSAFWRQESRGVHNRIDHPNASEAFAVHDVWRRGSEMPETHPVADAEVRA